MATFSLVPKGFLSTLTQGAIYGFTLEEAESVDLRVTDAQTGTLLSVRRFVDTLGAEVDIAPVIRRTATASPQSGATSLHATDRREVMVNVALHRVDDGALLATAPTRSFLCSTSSLAAPCLYTTMPDSRVMAPTECDLLLLHFDTIEPVTISAVQGRMRTSTTLTPSTVGVKELRIAAADFPGAERLEITAGDFCRIRYTLFPAPEGSVRLAWRTACGSIEHYTFPVVVRKGVEIERTSLRENNPTTVGDSTRTRHILSAFEAPAVAEAIAEVISSPEVWEVTPQGYRKVEVVTRKISIESRELFSTVELTICEPIKGGVLWN